MSNKNKNIKNVFSYQENGEEDETNIEVENQEYFIDTINIIRKNILDYVEDNSLPLCEFLSLKNVKTLLYNSKNF
jgi:hypothetical protein